MDVTEDILHGQWESGGAQRLITGEKEPPFWDSDPLKGNVGRRFVHPCDVYRSLGSVPLVFLGVGVMPCLTLNTVPAGDTLSPFKLGHLGTGAVHVST